MTTKGTYDKGTNQYEKKGKYKVKGQQKGQTAKSAKPKKPLNPSFDKAFVIATPQRGWDNAANLGRKWSNFNNTLQELAQRRNVEAVNNAVGGWVDEKTNTPLIETSRVYSIDTTNAAELKSIAKELANEYNQDAVMTIIPDYNGKDEWVEWDTELNVAQMKDIADATGIKGFTASNNKFCLASPSKTEEENIAKRLKKQPSLRLRANIEFVEKDTNIDGDFFDDFQKSRNERYGDQYGRAPPDYDEWLSKGVVQNSNF